MESDNESESVLLFLDISKLTNCYVTAFHPINILHKIKFFLTQFNSNDKMFNQSMGEVTSVYSFTLRKLQRSGSYRVYCIKEYV